MPCGVLPEFFAAGRSAFPIGLQYQVAEGEPMKLLFGVGLVVLILGIASFFIPIPRNERDGGSQFS
jgi:hypothetical protein